MNKNINKEQTSKTLQAELLRPGVVEIPYTLNGRRWSFVVYNEPEGLKVRINEFKNNVRKKIKDKEDFLPNLKNNIIIKNKNVFIQQLGIILDTYIGKDRIKIPQKVEEAYTLLIQNNKDKIHEVTKQKSKEIKENISINKEEKLTNEEKKLMEVFKDKSIDEIRKIIKREENKPKMKKLYNKIRKTMLILGITGSLARGIWTRAKKDAKDKRVYDTEQGIGQKKDNNDQAGIDGGNSPKEKITLDTLQKSIPKNILKGLEYQEIIDAVTAITNEEIQTQVIAFLEGGNVIGLQELYGMKKNSEYTSNKATGIIDQNTLKKIKNPLFGLKGEELLNNPSIPDDVKEAYKKFLNNTIPNDGLAYLILSKKTCRQYLFNKNHELINDQTILIGKDVGKSGEFRPYDRHKSANGNFIYVRGEINTNTPTGIFKVKKIVDIDNNYKVDGPKRGINIVPITIKGDEEERFKYKRWGIMIHPVYETPDDPEKYEDAMKSAPIDDNSISHGCPNIKDFGIVFDQLPVGSKVYIAAE